MAGGKTRLMAALCSLSILATFIGGAQSVSCCLKYTHRLLPFKWLIDYTVQTINNSCDINAIIFHTGIRFVCADPSQNWTQRGMKCVDDLKKRKTTQSSRRGTSGVTTTTKK
ncbi:C-C motif chemokine 20b [Brachyistius frenatus]|uniref:C-C motif chemokine 20b n=1 Tax=Brachyistius frenatus TaxID=100188 RepID=UPI0037E9C342